MLWNFWNAWKIRKGIKKPVIFIENAGGCICTKSIFNGKTPIKWCFRVESVAPEDNGWRFIGKSDSESYINIAENNVFLDFNTLANINPSILMLYHMPVGTDLYIVKDKGKIRFFKTGTKEEIEIDYGSL